MAITAKKTVVKSQKVMPRLSIVIPVFNEAQALPELYRRIMETLKRIPHTAEVIFIDDGSTDSSYEVLKDFPNVRSVSLRRNYGQTIALSVGIRLSVGQIIITMDSDLENHPEDIPAFLQKIEEGHDVITGWRQKRWHDAKFTRKLPSILANKLLSKISNSEIHDFGCTLKAYRREWFDSISFSGGMHRLFVVYMIRKGAKVTELPVSFTPRKFGKSNYGMRRTFDVLIDVLAVYFFETFHNRPLHFFGVAGLMSFCGSFASFILMLILKFQFLIDFIETPLPVLTVSLGIVGFQFILMGLIAEMIYRSTRPAHETPLNIYIGKSTNL